MHLRLARRGTSTLDDFKLSDEELLTSAVGVVVALIEPPLLMRRTPRAAGSLRTFSAMNPVFAEHNLDSRIQTLGDRPRDHRHSTTCPTVGTLAIVTHTHTYIYIYIYIYIYVHVCLYVCMLVC